MKHFVFIALFFLSGLAAGCSTAVENSRPVNSSPSPTSTPPQSSPAPAEEPSEAPDFLGTVGVTDKRNIDIKANGVLADVRQATHDGYDRLVFEFLGPEIPGYHVEYIKRAVEHCGSGKPVKFTAEALLEVRFTDAVAHSPGGDTTIKDRERMPNLPVVKQMNQTCNFEGEVTWTLGIPGRRSYRVLELKNPTRLAVDIKHR